MSVCLCSFPKWTSTGDWMSSRSAVFQNGARRVPALAESEKRNILGNRKREIVVDQFDVKKSNEKKKFCKQRERKGKENKIEIFTRKKIFARICHDF